MKKSILYILGMILVATVLTSCLSETKDDIIILRSLTGITENKMHSINYSNLGYRHYNLLTNIDSSIPILSILNQEVVYLYGVPILIETYIYNGLTVEIGSLLEHTQYGYRIIKAGEEISQEIPIYFMESLLYTSERLQRSSAQNSPKIYCIDDEYMSPDSLTWRHRSGRDDSSAQFLPNMPPIPGTRVQHWFDWAMREFLIGTDIFIGAGGMSATVLDIAPAETISLTETITVNSLALSASFPAGFGLGLSPNVRNISISGHNTLFVSTSRSAFTNSWVVPTLGATLLTIQTNAVSASRVNHSVLFGNPASVSTFASQLRFWWSDTSN